MRERAKAFGWKLGCVLCAAWIAFGTAGCGTKQQGTTLRIAWMGSQRETYAMWQKAFEVEHPGVTLEVQFIPYDQGPTVYNTMIQGDNLPDLGYVFMGMIPEYAERGVLEPMDAHLSEADKGAFLPGPLDAARYRGTLYGMPLSAANRTLYVRKGWMAEAGFTEPPNSWEEVRALGRAINRPPERYGFCIGASRQKHLMQEQMPMMWGFGARFFDDRGNLAINSPEAVEYVKFLTDMHLVDRMMPPGILTLNANECYDEMTAGKVGMLFSGPWQHQMCANAGWECIPLPVPSGRNQKMMLIVDVFTMFSTSKHKDLALAFMKFIQRPENRTLLDVEVGGVPVTRELTDHPYYQSLPIQVYLSHADILSLTPKHPEWTRIQDGWGEAIQVVLSETGQPKEALDTIYDRLVRELETPTLPGN